MGSDPTEAAILLAQLERRESELAYIEAQREQLVIRSPADGQFVVGQAQDMTGKYVHKGDLLGHVVLNELPILLVTVPETVADRVRRETRGIEVRIAGQLDQVRKAVIVRERPYIDDQAPHAALTTLGGGSILLNPSDQRSLRSLDRMMQFELAFLDPMSVATVGQRAHIRFEFENEPAAVQIYRTVRQLFLGWFNV